jgi:hypothetical protein
LGDDHGRRREEKSPLAQRPGSRQGEVDEEPHDDGRQAEQGVQHADHGAASREAGTRQPRREGQADQGGERRRGQADLKRQRDDRHQVRVAARHQIDRQAEGGGLRLHHAMSPVRMRLDAFICFIYGQSSETEFMHYCMFLEL